ncbi:MAG: hypothetical protein GF364_14455, partial [Candidatus Lokiarchaeota archaeon]|nr:hypothetical protein [Candidatus Lokiarchaeota archaeon]
MVKLSEIKEGQEFNYEYGPVTRDMITEYGNASGDKNPIHMDENFAVKYGKLGGVIAHGMLSLGIAIKFLSDLVGDGEIINVDSQMRGMVRPGDMYILNYKIEKIDGDKVSIDITEKSKTPIKIEKDGEIVKKFEAEEKGGIKQKDID